MELTHPTIVIVTGKPASGKSTLAKRLSQELHMPLVGKDSIREQLFDRLGWKDRQWAQELGKASIDMMFYFAWAELKWGIRSSWIILSIRWFPIQGFKL